jgi:hypothetical protein
MKGKKALDWKEGFSQALIGQRKTNLRKGLMGRSLNLWFLLVLKGKRFMIRRSVCEKEKQFSIWVYVCVIYGQRMCVNKRTWKNTMCNKE